MYIAFVFFFSSFLHFYLLLLLFCFCLGGRVARNVELESEVELENIESEVGFEGSRSPGK